MLPVLPPAPATEFRDPRAVDVWDGSFRWRRDGILQDLTIDDTWSRVARALTPDAARQIAYREAFARLRLLPDARLLRHAGTDVAPRLDGCLAVVLNAAAFVARRRFDHAAFAAAAALAAQLWRDARALLHDDLAPAIGLIGFDEACAALGLDGAGARAPDLARRLASELALHVGRQALVLSPQPLLAQLANHVSDGFDGPASDALRDAVRSVRAGP